MSFIPRFHSKLGFVAAAGLAALPAAASLPVSDASAAGGCPSGSRVIGGGDIGSALAKTRAGGTLCLNGGSYTVRSTVDVSKRVRIIGVRGPRLTQTFSGNFFRVGASNVTIRGLKMQGAHRNRTGESCGGTGAVLVGAVSGARILGNTASRMTCGIQLNGSSRFLVRGNKLSGIKYAGIATFPASHGTITRNRVVNVNHDGSVGENAYGIVASGNRSRNIVISRNVVNRAPTWECYDTHDGQAIDFLNNTCIAPGRVGINHVNSGIADPSGRVEGNTIDAGGLRTQWNSIAFGGSGTVKNNRIKGFGSCKMWTPRVSPSGNSCR